MATDVERVQEFYRAWIARHPKLLGKSVVWPGDVNIMEFAADHAKAEVQRTVGEITAKLRAESKRLAALDTGAWDMHTHADEAACLEDQADEIEREFGGAK